MKKYANVYMTPEQLRQKIIDVSDNLEKRKGEIWDAYCAYLTNLKTQNPKDFNIFANNKLDPTLTMLSEINNSVSEAGFLKELLEVDNKDVKQKICERIDNICKKEYDLSFTSQSLERSKEFEVENKTTLSYGPLDILIEKDNESFYFSILEKNDVSSNETSDKTQNEKNNDVSFEKQEVAKYVIEEKGFDYKNACKVGKTLLSEYYDKRDTDEKIEKTLSKVEAKVKNKLEKVEKGTKNKIEKNINKEIEKPVEHPMEIGEKLK